MRYLLVLLIGCGGGASGEPIMGSVKLMYGDDSPKLAVGAAVDVEDVSLPNRMRVQLGTDNVDCTTNLDEEAPKGSFVYFEVDTAVFASRSTQITVLEITNRSLSLNSAPGSVEITSIEPTVAGSVTFETVDEDDGTITVSGT